MHKLFKKSLLLPELRGDEQLDLDSPSTIDLHRRIIRQKAFLHRLYADFYANLLKPLQAPESRVSASKIIVELGSGAGFLKDLEPLVVTSDIVPAPGCDVVLDAAHLPFKLRSVDAFIMLNVLHHLPSPASFFGEAENALKPGGKIILIEPANSLWARLIYSYLHHEPFDSQGGWELDGHGRLTSANVALAWIILIRDKAIFSQRFPHLKIRVVRYHTPFRYLLSGGLSTRQLVPDALFAPVRLFEKLLGPLNRYAGLFMTVELEHTAPE